LFAIGLLTLLIAFVNFVNLSLAMAPSRIRGINIRKILGLDKTTLRLTIAMESVFFTLIALALAFLGVSCLRETTFARELFPTIHTSLVEYETPLAIVSLVILAVSFFIGLYTMRYSTSVDEADSLKGSYATGVKGAGLRNVLIVIQFTAAMVLICLSIFINRQNRFMQNYDWGIPKENIVYLPTAGLGQKANAFGEELMRNPQITDYCISRALPGNVQMNWGRRFEGLQISLAVWSVDERFFHFFDVPIVAGRAPDMVDSVYCQLVMNEAFLKKYDFDESIVGKDFDAFGPGRIVGIAKDVNFESLRSEIRPMAFGVLTKWKNFNYIMVKLEGGNVPETIRFIESTWNKFNKEPFEIHFLDESMDQLYQKEMNMAKLIGLFGLIIVLIAVMGVYGLIVFNTRYKAKEIAIRKVNGSSERQIMVWINRSVLVQLAIAFVISVPIAGYVTTLWLENFAYKIAIEGWVFLLGGLIVLAITLITVSLRSYRSATANPTQALNKE
jgi:putative ABC transport system permease protein